MTKRKRGDSGDEYGTGSTKAHGTQEPDYRRQRQIAATFEQSAQRLEKAFKLAKAFERQKLGRRQKQHKSGKLQQKSRTGKKKNDVQNQKTPGEGQEKSGSEDELGEEDNGEHARIEAEIAALKMLDTSASARHFLAKSLLKIKAVSSDPNLPTDISSPVPVRALTTDKSSATATASSRTVSALPASTALLNVHARLCNSNPVKQAFSAAIADVKHELGVQDGSADGKKPKRLPAKDFAKPAVPAPVAGHINGDDDSDIDMGQYAGRLASSDDEDDHRIERNDSDDDDGAEGSDEDMDTDMDVAQLERQLAQEGLLRMPDHSGSDSDSEDEAQPTLASTRKQRTAKASSSAAPVKSSSFVPLLTMGGYISGSGSDIDDQFEAEKPKKNRRGQRARQAIWEKKFGKTAKHLQHQGENAAWDPRKGAVSGSTSKFAKDANRLPLGKNRLHAEKKKVADAPKKPPRRDDSGPLHPSWEAAKKAKEKKSAPVAFQGKKISFD